MPELSNRVYLYYLRHFSQLSEEKQFHFASRLCLWSQDEATSDLLIKLKPSFTCDDRPEEALRQIVATAKGSPIHGSQNASELRKPYFERYPLLKMYVIALFRVTFLYTIYHIDIRPYFYELFPREEIESYKKRLLNDPEALAILSTHGINFLYLCERILESNEATLSPDYFLHIGRTGYDLNSPIHIQLLIYLYTHCIIGESKFYARALPQRHIQGYRTMISELERLIADRFEDINLDNKFEFLVCAELVGLPSGLQERIFSEAAQSLSSAGDYLVDTLNNNPQSNNTSLDTSEHRNVLFIMATRDFKPLA